MTSTDQGLANIFIHAESKVTPASPQTDTSNGGSYPINHGWYGAPLFFIMDSGLTLSNIFVHAESLITPASPQTDTSNGGNYPINHGWYGAPTSLLTDSSNNNINMFATPALLNFGGSQHHYLMQAYESGGGCSGNVQRIWLAVGTAPDLTGSQYSGTRCTPPGTFANYSILAQW